MLTHHSTAHHRERKVDFHDLHFELYPSPTNHALTCLLYTPPIANHALFVGVLETITEGKGDPTKDVLVELFRDGKILKEYTFAKLDDIRYTF
jgi:hypothetical protein